MYSKELIDKLINLIAPDYTPREDSEAHYPARTLPEGAEVVRMAPSPTGFVHIGTIYTGLINEYIARQSGGFNILRIEDTDKKREVEGSVNQILDNFSNFGITFDEGPSDIGGEYGPYLQSERAKIYLGFAIELLQKGRAYPCFASSEELEAAVNDQQAKKLRPGYYGQWALWRDKSEAEIAEALDVGKPFVLRFRSEGSHDKRIDFKDKLKGKLELPQNDLDVPLIKSDEHRLPTYHLAHVVDDYLMRTTLVIRGDEWLPSTPLHIELCLALGIKPFKYAHLAPLSIIGVEGGKRKLSKRKDAEANFENWINHNPKSASPSEVKQFFNPDIVPWVNTGYPIEGIKAYLLGLANSNFEDWYRDNPDKPLKDFPFSMQKLAMSRAPLLDMIKLESYCKEYISRLPQEEFNKRLISAQQGVFKEALESDTGYTNEALAIERSGDKPRKDLAAWGDAIDHYGYFFDDVFQDRFKPEIEHELNDGKNKYDNEVVEKVLNRYLSDYDYNDNAEVWLAKVRAGAEETNLHMRDYTKIIRVKLTGKSRTPDLYTIQRVMREERVLSRLS